MKYLAVILFIGSLSAVKSEGNFKYSLNLKTSTGYSEWPMTAVLEVEANNPLGREVELLKKGKNIKDVQCTLDSPIPSARCRYDDASGNLVITNTEEARKLTLRYQIDETSQLELWKFGKTPSNKKILAGNLAGEDSQVLLVEKSGAGKFQIKLDDKPVVTWRDAKNVKDVVFLGGDVETGKDLITRIFYAKEHFENGVKILTDFVKGFEIITGKVIQPGLLLLPIDLPLTGLQQASDFAQLLHVNNGMKFSNAYLAFVKGLIRNGLGGSDGSTWESEAFVNYLSYYIISKYNEDFGSVWYDRFLLDVIQNEALEKDGFKSSVQLQKLPGKGASLMHSLRLICGDEKFHGGIKNYFRERAGPNIAQAFQECFKSAAVANGFFEQYVKQSGYPVLHVLKKEGGYKLYQEQFFWSETDKTENVWQFPLSYNSKPGKVVEWVSQKEQDLQVTGASEVLLFNSGYNGYYRVNYPEKDWRVMTNYQKIMGESAPTRAQIINDFFSFSKSTFKFSHPVPNYMSALELVSNLKHEGDYLPMKAAFNAFEFLESSLGGELNSRFKDFVRDIVKDLYNKSPLNGTSKGLLRREVGFWACRLGVESCVKHAKQILEEINKKSLISSLSSIASATDVGTDLMGYEVPLCVGIRDGNDDLWKDLFSAFETIENGPELLIFVRALGCTKKNSCLQSLIEVSGKVSWQDDVNDEVALLILGGNPENVDTVLQYLIDKIENPKPFHKRLVRLALSKANERNLDSFKRLKDKWNDATISSEVEQMVKYMNEWKKEKLSFIRDSLPSGESKTTPIALIVLFSAMLPFLNSIFNN